MTGPLAFELAARSFERADRWLHNPVDWVDTMVDLGPAGDLTGYQRDSLEQLAARHRLGLRSPHGAGKTMVAALAALWFATTREAAGIDWKVITTASAWRQLTLYLWPEIHKWAGRLRWDKLGRGPFNRRTELFDLHLKGRHGLAAAVASADPARIEGAHADSIMFIFDEAKTIPAGMWDAAEGALAGGQTLGLPEAYALALSTPGAPAGRFYDIHTRKPGLRDWHPMHVTLEQAITAGRISSEWAVQRAQQWGPESAIYTNRVLGEFHAGDEDVVIPLAWAEAAVERWLAWGAAGRPDPGPPYMVGVDVARTGADSTVLAHRANHVITTMDAYRRQDTMQTVANVQGALTGEVTAVVDTAGIGAGVTDRLRELALPVVAYTGAARTGRRDRSAAWGFVNTRSAAYWHVRELLDPAFDPVLALPPDEQLLADLCAPTWDEQTGIPPRIRVEPKDQLVARLGRSTDWGDAVVMALWPVLPSPAHVAAVSTFADTGSLRAPRPGGGSPFTGNGNGHSRLGSSPWPR